MYDFCIIGGGIVGLSTAYKLLETFPGCSLVIVEKERQLCQHQTGHNSGVIHSGIYYSPDSFKAKLCKQGASEIKTFCRENNIPFDQCGKLLVATSEADMTRMRNLAVRAKENQVEFEHLDEKELRQREPDISGLGALFVPSTAIVDYKLVSEVLAQKIRDADAEIKLDTQIKTVEERPDHVHIVTQSSEFTAGQLIACAGIQSDRVARLCGLDPGFRIIPFRGEYFKLRPELNRLISALIYPIPDPALPFLGIHLTRTINDEIIVGPNAVLGMAREKYPKGSFDGRDMSDMLTYSGFWHVLRKHLRVGISEMCNSMFLSVYLKACRKYCPSLTRDDFIPREAGIRAQAVWPDGSFVQDFLFKQTRRMIHVCNAPSPAATSSLPIGTIIAQKALSQRQGLE